MSVMVLFEAPVKPDQVSNMKTFLAEIFPGTRSYEGCEGINAYFNVEDKAWLVMIEYWNTRQHHAKYVAWRTETGVMAKLGEMLAGPPNVRYFERVAG